MHESRSSTHITSIEQGHIVAAFRQIFSFSCALHICESDIGEGLMASHTPKHVLKDVEQERIPIPVKFAARGSCQKPYNTIAHSGRK